MMSYRHYTKMTAAPVFLLLSLVFMLQDSGAVLILKTRQQLHRQRMKEMIGVSLTDEGLSLVKIPQSLEEQPGALFVRTESWEFRYRGRMYDIVRQERHNDTTWYYCIYDVKETALVRRLEKAAEAQANAGPVLADSAVPYPGTVLCLPQPQPHITSPLPAGTIPARLSRLRHLWYLSPPLPPPQLS